MTISGNDYWALSGAPLNVGGPGAQGDSAAKYIPPAAQTAQTVNGYASWSGDGIKFQPINTSLIGTMPAGEHAY